MNTEKPAQTPHTASDLLPGHLRRFIPLLAVIGVALGVVGFVSGIREPKKPVRESPAAFAPRNDVPAAVDYTELATIAIGPNANWSQNLSQLKYDRPGIFDPVIRTEDMKLQALADRSKNRAYDGAPPVIPHAVESQSAAACLVCHGQGLKIGDRVASKISHAHYTSCTQCHVESAPVGFLASNDTPKNDFQGRYRAGPGQRASAGAPPTIPHTTWMREDCNSCHGLVTRAGTRTTHPWLSSCTQCHAPSAEFDQVEFFGVAR
jgi:cytochrome c-type protein NapB